MYIFKIQMFLQFYSPKRKYGYLSAILGDHCDVAVMVCLHVTFL